MATVYSAIDPTTRLEIHDLLARFCHDLDHGDVESWDSLFTRGAIFTSDMFGTFEDPQGIRLIPELVHSLGNGLWRFHFLNTVLSPVNRRHVIAKSTLATLDCDSGLASRRVYDCVVELKLGRWWQIARVNAISVQKSISPEMAMFSPDILAPLTPYMSAQAF
ncbi:MAG TPA: nuclear transport factor 2 family protein [Sphingobium sp.]